MMPQPNLLIVDDEDVVCQSCTKILSAQGYRVETLNDARKALATLEEGSHQYSAILLDLILPGYGGIDFLRELRKRGKGIPVIIITGYPSVESAIEAMRLGAADYVAKPFTPAELLAAVQRTLGSRGPGASATGPTPTQTGPGPSREQGLQGPPRDMKPSSPIPAPSGDRPPTTSSRATPSPKTTLGPWAPQEPFVRFMGESFVALGKDGTVRVGILVQTKSPKEILVPQIGETIYRGLPLAALQDSQGTLRTFLAPLSGEVVEVNPQKPLGPSVLVGDLAATAWLLRLRPTNLEEEISHAAPLMVMLATQDELMLQKERQRLTALGCSFIAVKNRNEAHREVSENKVSLFLVDAPSLGAEGPIMVREVLKNAPNLNVVVLDDTRRQAEGAYRESGVTTVHIKPISDADLTEIVRTSLTTAQAEKAHTTQPSSSSRSIRRIRLTNRSGKQVSLLVDKDLLEEKAGVGGRLVQRILDHAFPLLIGLGSEPLSAARVLEEAAECDRVFVLRSEDLGRIPGSILKDQPVEVVQQAGAAASKVTTLTVQPPWGKSQRLVYGEPLDDALAGFLLEEMTR